jgi:deoxyadenosine/deoxycytidine kinase
MKKIVVISGAWCTGKTHMANKLSELLGWPVFSLDFYKEKRFDQGETGRLIEESYDDLFDGLVGTLNKEQSCIVESDFTDEKQVRRLIEVADQVEAKLTQVFLSAEPKVLHERFIKRLESGERHSGHGDEQYLEKAKASLESGNYSDEKKFSPLNLPGLLIEIDTSDFNRIDYNSIVNQINSV